MYTSHNFLGAVKMYTSHNFLGAVKMYTSHNFLGAVKNVLWRQLKNNFSKFIRTFVRYSL